VFVVRGDLTTLACDAWLLPTDRRLRVRDVWHPGIPAGLLDRDRLSVTPPDGWGGDRPISFPLPDTSQPAIWATDVGEGRGDTPLDWFRDALAAFVDGAAATVAPGRRSRPLLAVPVVGAGAAGGGEVAGALVRELADELAEAVQRTGADVVLVTHDEAAFAAVQAARRPTPPGDPHTELHRLAALARRGQLALFIGGGASMGAGLPSWRELIERLADEAGLPHDQRVAFRALDVLDQARIVQHRLADRGTELGALVADLLDTDHTSLVHVLLANLPVTEIVTTNFDRLFELASEGAGTALTVLPYQRSAPSERWLLKLHGSIERPEEIVLTREDFLRFRERRAALAGIVQAMLLTKHLLFVGFSLNDDNFHRIVDEVRRARRPDGADLPEPFGTALLLGEEPILAELWAGEVTFVAAGTATGPRAEGARRLEILLDELVRASGEPSTHLLDRRFDPLLSDDERRLRDALADLAARADEFDDAPAWAPVAELLGRLGWDPTGSR
jgi:hypothetical protein